MQYLLEAKVKIKMFSGDQPPPPLAKAKQLIQKGCWRLQVQMFQ